MSEERLQKIVQVAFQEAISRQHEYVTLEHLLVAVLDDVDILIILETMGISASQITDDAKGYLDVEVDKLPEASAQAKRLLLLNECFNVL